MVAELDSTALLRRKLVEWLLEGEPWVTYRTLTDLLGRDEQDGAAAEARRAISGHASIRKIFAAMNKEGYWGSPQTSTLGGLRRAAPSGYFQY